MDITLDWNNYIAKAREVVSEGCVLLENHNNALPFTSGSRIAVFGRIQHNYYKSGNGSGGLVNVTEVTGVLEGLRKTTDLKIDEELEKIYLDWEKLNPFEEGEGWATEPLSQKEMPLSEDVIKSASERNDEALVIIGRTSGEDRDSSREQGAWLLTDTEMKLLKDVRTHFKKMTVLLNTNSIMDMSFLKELKSDAVMYVWQGGMTGGLGIADILSGKVSPSGKLAQTIAEKVENYPSDKNFGDPEKAVYEEDIYVGYRFFETNTASDNKKDKTLYPFGYGLSYTEFSYSADNFSFNEASKQIEFSVTVKNTGKFSGKESVLIFAEQPQGLLGKPERILIGFKKTNLLASGESEKLEISINLAETASSFDDTGITGNKSCFVLEAGTYSIFAGKNIRSLEKTGEIQLKETVVTQKLSQALAPVKDFSRLKNTEHGFTTETIKAVPYYQNNHRQENLSKIKTGTSGSALFSSIADKFTDEDLCAIIRGEGMGSPKVTPGTAAAFGGVTESLKKLGLPCACCSDGPSGMRLDSGAQAFSLPSGTLQACTFNTELVTELYAFTALEMVHNKIDVLLGPGINIMRHPLNGRNFEYFSEDPLLSGLMAAATLKGLQSGGVTGAIKHFCCNNQETGRTLQDAIVSERALREIYLKPFEIAVKNGADTIMTSYNRINGMWAAGNFDLNTRILRDEWGFKGFVMTDWWASMNNEGEDTGSRQNFAQMARAQNDIYMTVFDAESDEYGENTKQALKDGSLTRDELLRNAEI